MARAKFVVSRRDASKLWNFPTEYAVGCVNEQQKMTLEEATTKFRRGLDEIVRKYANFMRCGRERKAVRCGR